MVRRIDLLLPPRDQSGIFSKLTEHIASGLEGQGVTTRILDHEHSNPKKFLEKIFQDPPQCTFSINGLLPDEEGRFLCDLLKLPHLAYVIDTPQIFFPLIKSKYTILACSDRFTCEVFRGRGSAHSFFLPFGVSSSLDRTESFQSRPVPITFFDLAKDIRSIKEEWSSLFSKEMRQILQESAELTLGNPKISYMQALVQVIDSYMTNRGDFEIKKVDFSRLLIELEEYVLAKGSKKILSSMKDFEVKVFKSGGYQEKIEAMRCSRVYLSYCPILKNGVCWDTLAASLCGAAVLADDSIYMKEHFIEGKELLYYDYQSKDIASLVAPLLEDEKSRLKMVEAMNEKVLADHTWDVRAQVILRELNRLLPTMVASV